jgi:hypothetical protein
MNASTSERVSAWKPRRPRTTVPPPRGVVLIRVCVEVDDLQGEREWLEGFDPMSPSVVVSAVEVSVRLELADVLGATSTGRTRRADLALEVRRGRRLRPEQG